MTKFVASVLSIAILVAGPGQFSVTAAAQSLTRVSAAGAAVAPTVAVRLNSYAPGLSVFPTSARDPLTSLRVDPAVVAQVSGAVPVSAADPAVITAWSAHLDVIQSHDADVGVDEKGDALNAMYDHFSISDRESSLVLGEFGAPAETPVAAPKRVSLRHRVLSGASVLVVTLAAAVPVAAAQAGAVATQAEGLPLTVKWIAGVTGFVGFLLGSIPPDGSGGIDLPGAVVWGASAALALGGAALVLTTGAWMPGALAAGFGASLGLMRYINTRLPRDSRGGIKLETGINRFEGATPDIRFETARRAFKRASFSHGQDHRSRKPVPYYAIRGDEFRYGERGMSAKDLELLKKRLAAAEYGTFEILVLLVRQLPDGSGPGVVVVDGKLRQLQVDTDGIILPGSGTRILSSTIDALAGYYWATFIPAG